MSVRRPIRVRFERGLGGHWALYFTRWLFLTNHAYQGERQFYVRLGRRPGWTRSFGPVVRHDWTRDLGDSA